jgi:hypothetical protein
VELRDAVRDWGEAGDEEVVLQSIGWANGTLMSSESGKALAMLPYPSRAFAAGSGI